MTDLCFRKMEAFLSYHHESTLQSRISDWEVVLSILNNSMGYDYSMFKSALLLMKLMSNNSRYMRKHFYLNGIQVPL